MLHKQKKKSQENHKPQIVKDYDKKLTFQENIYYWLWYYSMRLNSLLKNHHRPPELAAIFIFNLMKFMGIFWLGYFLASTFNLDLSTIPHWNEFGIFLILLMFPILLFFLYRDEQKYEKRVKIISQKMNCLKHKERLKKKRVFFLSLAIYIVVYGFIVNATVLQPHKPKYPIPVYKLPADDN